MTIELQIKEIKDYLISKNPSTFKEFIEAIDESNKVHKLAYLPNPNEDGKICQLIIFDSNGYRHGISTSKFNIYI